MKLPKRKNIRLKDYDYSQNGVYFITICTQDRRNLFGSIDVDVGQGLCSCRLTDIGNIVENEIVNLSKRFQEININKYIIMPNHIHMIVVLAREGRQQNGRQEQSPCPTNPNPNPNTNTNTNTNTNPAAAIGDIICAFKSITTKQANKYDGIKGRKIWQFRYHDHIIRNEDDYLRIWQYIDENPTKWAKDRYYYNS